MKINRTNAEINRGGLAMKFEELKQEVAKLGLTTKKID